MGFTLRNGANADYKPAAADEKTRLENCVVEGCAATDWNGVLRECTLVNCVVKGCSAPESPLIDQCELENCAIAGNAGSAAILRGCQLWNCTVAGNQCGDYAAAVEWGGAWNSIVWGNVDESGQENSEWINYETDEEGREYAYFPYTNCCIAGFGELAERLEEEGVDWEATGCFEADPRFVDAANGDVRLRVGSPCIDAGTTEMARGKTDAAGNARVRGKCIDLGCYESEWTAAETGMTAVEGEEWWYSVADGVATVVRGPTNGVVEIPGELGGHPVGVIGARAFYGAEGLTAVEIPRGVTRIGTAAFSECDTLETAVIPEGVERIGTEAFYDCRRLAGVTLPESLAEIGNYAFGECFALQRGDIAGGVKRIGEWAFAYCRQLETVVLSEGLERLGEAVFAQCTQLGELWLPGSLVEIGENAFSCREDGLRRLEVPAAWKGTEMLAETGVPEGCEIVYYGEEGGGALPEIADASEIEGALAGAAGGRLKAKITSAEAYDAFRAWALGVKGSDGELAGAEGVLASEHAWPSYLLGAEALFGEEPEIRLAIAGIGSGAGGGGETVDLRVTVLDGGRAAAVDGEKVGALLAGTGDAGDWAGAAVPLEVAAEGLDGDSLRFEVAPGAGAGGAVFLRLAE